MAKTKRNNRVTKQKKSKPKKHMPTTKMKGTIAKVAKFKKESNIDMSPEHNKTNYDVDDEDLKYVSNISSDYSFLYKVKQRYGKNSTADGVDEDNEDKPRQFKQDLSQINIINGGAASNKRNSQGEVKHLLPIKVGGGKLIHQALLEQVEGDVENESVELQLTDSPVKRKKLFSIEFNSLDEAKEKIASYATAIISDPENNISKLKRLQVWLNERHDIAIVQLMMISLLEIYKDILPEYKLRLPTEKEREQKAKKETRELRNYEESLLRNYKSYLQTLERFSQVKEGKYVYLKNVTSLRCLTTLLIHHHNFNYSTNIITCILPFFSSNNSTLQEMVCECVEKLFIEHTSSPTSLDMVKSIGKLVKEKPFKVKPNVIDTFLSLQIHEVDTESGKEKENRIKKNSNRKERIQKMSRSQRRRNKELEKIEKELEAAEAVENKKNKLKLNTEMVTHIFTTYFRVMKKSPHSRLLSSVLRGLSKFAHCINVDFYPDLFSTLHQLLLGEIKTPLQSLLCIQTVFTILSGQGQLLTLDPHRFYVHFYRVVPEIKGSEQIEMLIRCIDMMFHKRRKQVSHMRVLAFVKRLAMLCVKQTDPKLCLVLLFLIRDMMVAFPKCDVLLDDESQGSGVYTPNLHDPDHCNAHNTNIFEIRDLKSHSDGSIRRIADHVINGCPVRGVGQLPTQFRNRSALDILTDFMSSS